MAICTECGSFVPDSTRFCPNCGRRADIARDWRPARESAEGGAAARQRPIPPFNERKPEQSARAQQPQGQDTRRNRDLWDRDAKDSIGASLLDDGFDYARPVSRDEGRGAPQASRQTGPSMQAGKTAALSVGEYLVRLLITVLPVIGLIFGFLWSRAGTNPNKRLNGCFKAAAFRTDRA